MDERIDNTVRTEPTIETTQDDSRRVSRNSLAVAGLAGLTYWLTGWATFPDGPAISTASAQQVRDHVSAQGGVIQGATIAGIIGVAASVVFLAAIVRQIRDRLPGSLLSDVVLGAGILLIAYQWLVVTAEGLLRLLPNLLDSVELDRVNDQTVLSWYALIGFTHFMGDLAIVPTVLLIGAFSLAARRGQLLPAWLVWVGIAISVAGIVGMVAILGEFSVIYPFWFAGLIGYFLWVLAISVTFLLRLRRTRNAPVAG